MNSGRRTVGSARRDSGPAADRAGQHFRPAAPQRLLPWATAFCSVAALAFGTKLAITSSRSFNSKTFASENRAAYSQSLCLKRRVRDEVPYGSRVGLGPGATYASQVRAQATVLWAVPEPARAKASWILTVVTSNGVCGGMDIEAVRLR